LVTLKIYDLSGRLVRTLIDGDLREGGYHAVRWNGNDENGDSVGSGMYIYKMETDEYRQTRRMILLK
jgi:flagellar hook assembly protein FlgD